MKKRTKKYQGPKYVAHNPFAVFGGMSDAHSSKLCALTVRNHRALSAIIQGDGDRATFDLLVGAINMGNVMCEMGIGDEFRPQMLAGRDALMSMGKRALRSGRFGFTGDELKAMNEALECHDTQLENIRAIDVERASDEVLRRVRHRINSTSVRAELEKEAA